MENLINEKFGELQVLGTVAKNLYQCKCSCGRLKIVSKYNLENLIVTDCGHIESDIDRLNRIYRNMKERCYNPKSKTYKYYGAKGIKICDKWLYSFKNFYDWSIRNGYSKKLTIDRIDNNKNYEPDNCKWSNLVEQNNNRSICHFIKYKGEVLTLSQWAKKCNISASKLLYYIKKEGENNALKRLLVD